jgi:hypothetical protein
VGESVLGRVEGNALEVGEGIGGAQDQRERVRLLLLELWQLLLLRLLLLELWQLWQLLQLLLLLLLREDLGERCHTVRVRGFRCENVAWLQ